MKSKLDAHWRPFGRWSFIEPKGRSTQHIRFLALTTMKGMRHGIWDPKPGILGTWTLWGRVSEEPPDNALRSFLREAWGMLSSSGVVSFLGGWRWGI